MWSRIEMGQSDGSRAGLWYYHKVEIWRNEDSILFLFLNIMMIQILSWGGPNDRMLYNKFCFTAFIWNVWKEKNFRILRSSSPLPIHTSQYSPADSCEGDLSKPWRLCLLCWNLGFAETWDIPPTITSPATKDLLWLVIRISSFALKKGSLLASWGLPKSRWLGSDLYQKRIMSKWPPPLSVKFPKSRAGIIYVSLLRRTLLETL